MKYYALDYVDAYECELVYDDQLYMTEAEAAAAREKTGQPKLFDITWYTIPDLNEIYDREIEITSDLRVR